MKSKIATRKLRTKVSLIALAALATPHFTAFANSATTQSANQSIAFTDQAKAQTVLDRAITSIGGYEALNAIRNSSVTFATSSSNPGQAPTPGASTDFGNAFKTVAHRSDGRLSIENYNGDNLGFRYVRGAGPDWVYLAGQNAVALIDVAVGQNILDRVNTSASLLLEMADNSDALRFAGTETHDGKTHSVLVFADSFGRAVNVYFDNETGRLAKTQTLTAHEQWGDTATTMSFGDYKDVNGALLAHAITVDQAGNTTAKITVENVSLEAADEALFTQPDDATQNDPFTAPSAAARDLPVEKLAKNIYFIPNAAQGYNVIFVNQRSGVLILETPQSAQTSRDVIRTIQKELPGRKIKWAVPTHHHFDHSGGLYGYLEAGIGILTTAGNVDFVNNVGNASRNIGQNGGTPEDVNITSFDDEKYSIGRGSRKVELYNVGPNPHAEEIIVMYIPEIKSLLVADIFSARGDTLPPANANQLAFAEKLESLNLDIETFIPVHGATTKAADFWDSVKRGREAQASE